MKFTYDIEVSLHRFLRDLRQSITMCMMLALGIGSTVLMLEVVHFLNGDSLNAAVSGDLHTLVINGEKERMLSNSESNNFISYTEYQYLSRINTGKNLIAADIQVPVSIDVGNPDSSLYPNGLVTSPDAINMLGLHLQAGRFWSPEEAVNHARVAVISSTLARQLYGNKGAIGKVIYFDSNLFRVIGILEDWKLLPHFYNIQAWVYSDSSEGYLIPIETASNFNFLVLGSQCITSSQVCNYLTPWVRCEAFACNDLAGSFQWFLRSQRGEPNLAVTVNTLSEWLKMKGLIPPIVMIGLGGSMLLFLICMLSVTGILLAKFRERSIEIGIHRALGASACGIMRQALFEALMYAVFASIIGLVLCAGLLFLLQMQPTDYASYVRFDSSLYFFLVLLLVVVTLFIGIVPAWVAIQEAPADLLGSST